MRPDDYPKPMSLRVTAVTLDGRAMTLTPAKRGQPQQVWRPVQWGGDHHHDEWSARSAWWIDQHGRIFKSRVTIGAAPGSAIRVSGDGLVPTARTADVGVEVHVRALSRGREETKATFDLVTPTPLGRTPSGKKTALRQRALRGWTAGDEWQVLAGNLKRPWHGAKLHIRGVPLVAHNPSDEDRLARRGREASGSSDEIVEWANVVTVDNASGRHPGPWVLTSRGMYVLSGCPGARAGDKVQVRFHLEDQFAHCIERRGKSNQWCGVSDCERRAERPDPYGGLDVCRAHEDEFLRQQRRNPWGRE